MFGVMIKPLPLVGYLSSGSPGVSSRGFLEPELPER